MDKRITALYCRVASVSEHSDFPEPLQERILRRHAKAHGYENVRCYKDIGFSGLTLSGRPAFRELQESIDGGEVGRVIVSDLSRIGRNTAEVLGWVSSLREKGVEIEVMDCPAKTLKGLLAVSGRLGAEARA